MFAYIFLLAVVVVVVKVSNILFGVKNADHCCVLEISTSIKFA